MGPFLSVRTICDPLFQVLNLKALLSAALILDYNPLMIRGGGGGGGGAGRAGGGGRRR